jgi:hypothetical protein
VSKIVLFREALKQSVKVIDSYPEAEGFVVLFKVFFQGFIEVFIGSLGTFDRTPIVTKNLTISDKGTIPLCLLNFHVVFHRFDMALQVNWLKVGSAGDSLNFLVIFPPSL